MTTSRTLTMLALVLTSSAAAASACRVQDINEEHCVRNDGDVTCAARYPDGSRPFCGGSCVNSLGDDGCVAERPADDCYSPCGNETYYDEDPTCEGIASSTDTSMDETMGPGPASDPSGSSGSTSPGTTSMTTGETTTEPETTETGPAGCDGPEDCEGGTPFCENGLCVACDQATDPNEACAGANAATPLCFEGACVACTEDAIGACEGGTPICDVGTNECRGCAFHEECQAMDAAACHIAEGSCITEVTEVDAGVEDSIQAAIDVVDPGQPHAIVITASGPVGHTIEIGEGRIIAIVSSTDDAREVRGEGGAPTLTVTGAGTVAYLHRVELALNGDSVGASVASSGTLYADSVRVAQNSGGGLTFGSGTTGFLRNTMVGSDNNVGAITVNNATVAVLYASLARGTNFGEPVIVCGAGSDLTVRNSIVFDLTNMPGSEIDCDGINLTDTAVESSTMPNVWFDDFTTGDLHLTAGGATEFADVAVWQSTDPPFDIDGEPRPGNDGDPDYAGADVP
jgi:hypothetical protein